MITFPEQVASHSTRQTFYFDSGGLLRRHDYDVEVAGNFAAAHYLFDYEEVAGFHMATKRRMFPRHPNNIPARDTVTIAIDLENIEFA